MRLDQLAQTPVGSIHRRDPIIVGLHAPIHDVLDAMRQKGRGAVLVEDQDGRLSGIFSERDVLLKLGHDDASLDCPVAELMTRQPKTIAPSEPVSRALQIMRKGDFRHLPMVDEEGRPTGVLSIRDILVWVSEHFPEEIVNLPPRPRRGAGRLYGG